MLHQILGVVLRSEVVNMRRSARRAVLGGGVAFLLLLAVIFAVISFFLWLATFNEPWLAALIVTGVLLGAALLLWAVGQVRVQSATRRRTEDQFQAAMDAALATAKKGDSSLAVMAAVLAAGYGIGRGLSK